MRAFEFHAYKGDADGNVATEANIVTGNWDETAAAKAYGGRMAKRVNGPVDIALAGPQPWNDRYITTASPSAHHANGFRFERIS